MTMNDPLLRTDSYAKIFLYNTHETVACVPRHTIRMRDKVRPDKLREAVEQALLRFPHMMLTAEPTETAFRYRRNVQPAVVLPFDGVSTRYTIGSKDTNGYLFLVGYHDKTIYMEYQHSISDGRGFEEFIRCVLFQYLKTAVSRLRMTDLCAAWIPAGLPRRAQTATSSWQTVNFRRMASGKSRRLFMPPRYSGALTAPRSSPR